MLLSKIQDSKLKDYEIICVGDLCVDLIIPYGETRRILEMIQRNPAWGEKKEVLFRSGGSVGNMAKILGKLKQHPILIADLANDQIGLFLKQEMENHGVNMDYSYISDRGSYLCIAVLDADNERTMFVWIPPWSRLDRFTGESFPEDLFTKPAIVFSSGMVLHSDIESGKAVIEFFKRMKENQSILVFDLNLRTESYGFAPERRALFMEMLDAVDIVLGSGIEEFGQITGKTDLYEAVKALARKDLCIIARDGRKPVLVHDGSAISLVETEKVKPVTTVGAGDTFDAAFLMALRQGYGLTRCVAFANKVAAYMISSQDHLAVPHNAQELLKLFNK